MEDGEQWPEVGRRYFTPDGEVFLPQKGDSVWWDHEERSWFLDRGTETLRLYAGKPPEKPYAQRGKKVRVLKCRDSSK